MADIFVSYARTDKARVAPLVAALESQGWSVWWDPAIVGGQAFDDLIGRELETARAVIVVWTAASVTSRWVRGEARMAADRNVLVPVQLGAPNLPIDARALHTIDLSDWHEDPAGALFQELARALGALLGPPKRAEKAEPDKPAVSICVLPFANMSDDREQEYFSDGISEDIITDLSKVSALLVISRNSAFTFKGKHVDLPEVARQLKVTHVLEGSVRKSGNRVRITAQLINGTTNGHVWAERYDRNLDDIFALQDEISEAIVKALKLKLLPEEKDAIENRGTTNVEAYDIFLRARVQMNRGATERAIELCRQAIALDPGFGPAYSLLLSALGNYRVTAPERDADIQTEMNEVRARRLAAMPDRETAILMGRIDELLDRQQFFEAEQLNETLIAQPGYRAEIERLARQAREPVGRFVERSLKSFRARLGDRIGRFQDVLDNLREAVRTDPLSQGASMHLQWVLDIAGHAQEAEVEYKRSSELMDNAGALAYLAVLRMWNRAAPEEIKMRWALSAATFLPGRAVILHQLEPALFDPPAARSLITAAFAAPEYQYAPQMVILCELGALFRDIDLSLAAMRRGYVDMGFLPTRGIWERNLAEVRKDPRFKEILRDLGLIEYWQKSGKWGDFVRPLGGGDFEVIR